MALVVFLKGINVGGHRTFRPSVLARELERFDVVNVGAAGTFIVRRPVGRTNLRAEITRRLPFEAEVLICGGDEILRLAFADPFADHASGPEIVRFVSVMAKRRTLPSAFPLDFPAEGDWSLRVLACQGRFVLGLYRRQMKSIGCLGQLEKALGVPLATRNWNTITAIAARLREEKVRL